MRIYKTLKVLEDSLGYVPRSGVSRQSLYYSIEWSELRNAAVKVADRRKQFKPGDVRLAAYALDLIGIPNHYVETGRNKNGRWIVYWR